MLQEARTALHVAAEYGHVAAVQALLAVGMDRNKTCNVSLCGATEHIGNACCATAEREDGRRLR